MYLFSQINILIISSCFTIRKKFLFYWHSHKCLNELTEKWCLYDMKASYTRIWCSFSSSPCLRLCLPEIFYFFPSVFQSKSSLWYNGTIHLKSKTNQNQKFLINGFETCTRLTKERCWEDSSMTQTHDQDLEDSMVYRRHFFSNWIEPNWTFHSPSVLIHVFFISLVLQFVAHLWITSLLSSYNMRKILHD